MKSVAAQGYQGPAELPPARFVPGKSVTSQEAVARFIERDKEFAAAYRAFEAVDWEIEDAKDVDRVWWSNHLGMLGGAVAMAVGTTAVALGVVSSSISTAFAASIVSVWGVLGIASYIGLWKRIRNYAKRHW